MRKALHSQVIIDLYSLWPYCLRYSACPMVLQCGSDKTLQLLLAYSSSLISKFTSSRRLSLSCSHRLLFPVPSQLESWCIKVSINLSDLNLWPQPDLYKGWGYISFIFLFPLMSRAWPNIAIPQTVLNLSFLRPQITFQKVDLLAWENVSFPKTPKSHDANKNVKKNILF